MNLSQNKHIIIHSQYYPPEVGAPQTRLHELAVGLLQRGFCVTVLTAMPNYPLGRVYQGYQGWLKVEDFDGVKIIRTAIYPAQSIAMLHRLLSYLSFVLSSLFVGWWKVDRADFLLTESPPLFLGLSGFFLSYLKKARWIFNVSDLWPESVAELGVISYQSPTYKVGSLLEEFLYKKAWMVSCQSRTILENIHARFPDIKVYHFPNGVNTELFQPVLSDVIHNRFRIIYAGLHGLAQGLEQILLAAHELRSTKEIEFIFVGDGPDKKRLVGRAQDLSLDHIRFEMPLEKKKIPILLNDADVIIVPLKLQLTGAVPSKLYEAMAIGKPVILIAGSEAAKIVREADCGIVVEPDDIAGLVNAIIYLKNNSSERKRLGENGRCVAIRDHDRAKIISDFAGFLVNGHPTHYEQES